MLHTAHRRTVVHRAGLLDDAGFGELSVVATGALNVRLILSEVANTCHCCVGTTTLIVAVSPDDPSLPEGLGESLARHGPGVALAASGSDHLVGTALVTETATIPIASADTPMPESALVLHLADAISLLPGSDVETVVVLHVRPGASVPDGWSRVGAVAGQVPVTVGSRRPAFAVAAT